MVKQTFFFLFLSFACAVTYAQSGSADISKKFNGPLRASAANSHFFTDARRWRFFTCPIFLSHINDDLYPLTIFI